MSSIDSFRALQTLQCGEQTYAFYSLNSAAGNGLASIPSLPFSRKILMENLLRHEDGVSVTEADIRAAAAVIPSEVRDIAFRPSRVLMQDNNAVPALVDMAALREAMIALGGPPQVINPHVPVDLIIDHSLSVDRNATADAITENLKIEHERHQERYRFLKWAKNSFDNLTVVPPGAGICHQINLEFLSRVVRADQHSRDGTPIAHFDTVVGTDSHTTMVNGLGVLGWGVGGIEAEAVMLGLPVTMRLPEVIGIRLSGSTRSSVTATDLVLTLTDMLRKFGAVGKFVEFFGPGLAQLSAADRATIANMAPEYGATCAFFPIGAQTTAYLRATGRAEEDVNLVETYAKAQGLWYSAEAPTPQFSAILDFPLDEVRTSIAGPRRPEDRIALNIDSGSKAAAGARVKRHRDVEPFALEHNDVVIAAITSCTNTSNPRAMIAAGILARNAVAKGLHTKPWVKSSLAPGSRVVAGYLQSLGLQSHLDTLGFHTVGFGCTTCIGNSGPLSPPIQYAIERDKLNTAAVLSGNRNFEGRIHPAVRDAYLASPPLVVAYAIAGTMLIDFANDPIGYGDNGEAVYLQDVWPSAAEINALIEQTNFNGLFRSCYQDIFSGDELWQKIETRTSATYDWNADSTYFKLPPYFSDLGNEPAISTDSFDARILGMFGDSVNTDQISPAGSIPADSPAGRYLQNAGVSPSQFNTYAARRGHHEVILRGTFANPRIRNLMLAGSDAAEGGFTVHFPSQKRMTIFDAAMRYQQENTPVVVLAGKGYGAGSSRDWAAKGTKLLGIRAVVAESFERIHRSNLIGMGVVPLSLPTGTKLLDLGLTGEETIRIAGLDNLRLGEASAIQVRSVGGPIREIPVKLEVDTPSEMEYLRHGGILPFVLRSVMASHSA